MYCQSCEPIFMNKMSFNSKFYIDLIFGGLNDVTYLRRRDSPSYVRPQQNYYI